MRMLRKACGYHDLLGNRILKELYCAQRPEPLMGLRTFFILSVKCLKLKQTASALIQIGGKNIGAVQNCGKRIKIKSIPYC